MVEIKEKTAFINPYVVQMDKFAESLVHLSKTFLTLEDYKGTFSKEEVEEMFQKVTDKVCENCEKREWCLGRTGFIPTRCSMKSSVRWRISAQN